MNAGASSPRDGADKRRTPLRRVLLTVEYDGTHYSGWQRQLNANSVQEELECAVSRFNGGYTAVTGASRTDAGVHALEQHAHFDAHANIPPEKWAYALNTALPEDIRITASREVPPDFHACYRAKGKVYAYLIANQPHAPALGRHNRAFVPAPLPLDEGAMRRAAQAMLGRQDFAAFAASGSVVRDTVRTIFAVRVERVGRTVALFVWGDGFLYNMVRILAGTLIDIGAGKLPESALREMIDTRDRLRGGPTAPAEGLTLVRMHYDLLPDSERRAREIMEAPHPLLELL